MEQTYHSIEEALEDLRAGKSSWLQMTRTGRTKAT